MDDIEFPLTVEAENLAHALSIAYEMILHYVATDKEWYLCNHARRHRTRKKYRNRLSKRVSALLD